MRIPICLLATTAFILAAEPAFAQALDNPTGAIGHVVSEQCSKDLLASNKCQFEIVTDAAGCEGRDDCYRVSTRRLGLTGAPSESQFEVTCYDDPKVTRTAGVQVGDNTSATIDISPFSPDEIVNLRAYNIWYAVCLNEFLKFSGDDQ